MAEFQTTMSIERLRELNTISQAEAATRQAAEANNCTNPPHFPPHCGCPAG